MITLRYALPPDATQRDGRTETVVTTIELEDTQPDTVAAEIAQLHEQNYDVTVTLRLKQPK